MPIPDEDSLVDYLIHAGFGEGAIQAVLDIDAVMQTWRRRMIRRELGHSAISDLGIELDMAQLDILTAIHGPRNEFGEQGGEETTVGGVADRLGIDPSRASRLVSEMVEAGYARRAVSQQDGRRAVIALTDKGAATVEAVRTYKFLFMGDFLSEWEPQEREHFVALLERFSEWSDRTAERRGKFTKQIQALAEGVAERQTRPVETAG